ncbi:LigA [Strigomonas culicis]|uniref:LigA n=1 Tax=Strigomonas culicis TaxID=28005 RepID=S9TJ47_9TRYP|nr:LigA [Strigomonas culicis]|eukprot:EPY16408.1 LigA [Strigomonas culicis]
MRPRGRGAAVSLVAVERGQRGRARAGRCRPSGAVSTPQAGVARGPRWRQRGEPPHPFFPLARQRQGGGAGGRVRGLDDGRQPRAARRAPHRRWAPGAHWLQVQHVAGTPGVVLARVGVLAKSVHALLLIQRAVGAPPLVPPHAALALLPLQPVEGGEAVVVERLPIRVARHVLVARGRRHRRCVLVAAVLLRGPLDGREQQLRVRTEEGGRGVVRGHAKHPAVRSPLGAGRLRSLRRGGARRGRPRGAGRWVRVRLQVRPHGERQGGRRERGSVRGRGGRVRGGRGGRVRAAAIAALRPPPRVHEEGGATLRGGAARWPALGGEGVLLRHAHKEKLLIAEARRRVGAAADRARGEHNVVVRHIWPLRGRRRRARPPPRRGGRAVAPRRVGVVVVVAVDALRTVLVVIERLREEHVPVRVRVQRDDAAREGVEGRHGRAECRGSAHKQEERDRDIVLLLVLLRSVGIAAVGAVSLRAVRAVLPVTPLRVSRGGGGEMHGMAVPAAPAPGAGGEKLIQ